MFLKPFKIEDEAVFSENLKHKTIIEDGDRKIILFALSCGQKIPAHYSPVDAMVYVIKGKISLYVDDKKITLKKEDALLIQNNKEHSVVAQKKSIFLVIRI